MLCLFRRLWIACLMLCITTFCVHAQNAITGTVKDVAGEPIIGANILVKAPLIMVRLLISMVISLWEYRLEESWKFLSSVM